MINMKVIKLATIATLKVLLTKNDYVTAKQLSELNFSGEQIKSYLKRNILVSFDRGIYGSPDQLGDTFYITQLRLKKGIISLNSALYLYGLSDRVPDKIDMTFPRGYKNPKLKDEVVPHQQLSKLYKLGIIKVKTPQGNKVKVYSLDRTIAEILRPQNHVDPEIINTAFKLYLKSPQKNMAKLMYFAKIFKTTKKVNNYLEVLL